MFSSFCYGPNAEETPFAAEAAATTPNAGNAVMGKYSEGENGGSERNCHFHAGVE